MRSAVINRATLNKKAARDYYSTRCIKSTLHRLISSRRTRHNYSVLIPDRSARVGTFSVKIWWMADPYAWGGACQRNSIQWQSENATFVFRLFIVMKEIVGWAPFRNFIPLWWINYPTNLIGSNLGEINPPLPFIFQLFIRFLATSVLRRLV